MVLRLDGPPGSPPHASRDERAQRCRQCRWVRGLRPTILTWEAAHRATYYASVAHSNDAAEDRPARTVIRDPEVIRVLAHPARITILEHLGATGRDITATEAAELVGLSPSATSYHLRALAKVNLIREAPSRGDGRERVYSAAPQRVEINSESYSQHPEATQIAENLIDVVLARSEERVRRWRELRRGQPEKFNDDVAVINEVTLKITADELTKIVERIDEMLDPYRQSQRKDAPEQARLVSLLVRSIPID
jgi:DNA-binding transcriptional ArsR family regulator